MTEVINHEPIIKPDRYCCQTGYGLTFSFAVSVMPPAVAAIFAVLSDLTATVVTVNVAELEPAATVTDAGTAADVESLDKATTIAAAARPVRVTVPVAVVEPTTADGAIDSDARVAGLIVRFAATTTPAAFA
jgi:S-ribosylhomocysteine lyase LuxS involved in autoinducer biosynthesis